MLTFTRLRQDLRSEMYQVGDEENDFGQLFVFFSPDFTFCDGYLYLNIEDDMSEEDADDLADEVIQRYLNYYCPLDYGQDYTSFEVNLVRNGESYLVELDGDNFFDDDDEFEYDDEHECGCGCGDHE